MNSSVLSNSERVVLMSFKIAAVLHESFTTLAVRNDKYFYYYVAP